MELFHYESFMKFVYVRRAKFPEGLIFTTPNSLLLFPLPAFFSLCVREKERLFVCMCVWSSSKTSSTRLNYIDPFLYRIFTPQLLEAKLFVINLLYDSFTIRPTLVQLNDLRYVEFAVMKLFSVILGAQSSAARWAS
jgi:hypothetical protein